MRTLVCLIIQGKSKKEMFEKNIVWEFLRCCAAALLFDFYSHCTIV